MKTAIPGILNDLGASEYTVLTSAYCKLQELRDHLTRMQDVYVADGTPPSLDRVEAACLLMNDVFSEVEKYVLALSAPGEDACPLCRKAA